MSRIVVFGAGGRAGRKVVAAARDRRHDVVPVVRDPTRYAVIDAVAGDVSNVDDVRRLIVGADAVVNATGRMDVSATRFFSTATASLLEGMGQGRLVVIGIGTMLEVSPGVRIMDGPEFPAEAKNFSEGHAAELDLLLASPKAIDWVVLLPPPVLLDEEAEEPLPYVVKSGSALMPSSDQEFSFADLGSAVIDVIHDDRLHRTTATVGRR
jgi:uncharacterized protein